MQRHLLRLSILTIMGLAGCQPGIDAPVVPKSEVCEDRSTITVGSLSNEGVHALKDSLGKLTFPAPAGTAKGLLTEKLTPVPVQVGDSGTGSRHTSGAIEDYWLNNEAVLRVSTFYFTPDKSRALEEWAVILAPQELDDYNRGFCDSKPKKGS